jgi:hypothetical protein
VSLDRLEEVCACDQGCCVVVIDRELMRVTLGPENSQWVVTDTVHPRPMFQVMLDLGAWADGGWKLQRFPHATSALSWRTPALHVSLVRLHELAPQLSRQYLWQCHVQRQSMRRRTREQEG